MKSEHMKSDHMKSEHMKSGHMKSEDIKSEHMKSGHMKYRMLCYYEHCLLLTYFTDIRQHYLDHSRFIKTHFVNLMVFTGNLDCISISAYLYFI